MMKRLTVLLLTLLLAVYLNPIAAQEPTTQRLFIVDIVSVTVNGQVYRSAEHFGGRNNPADAELAGLSVSLMDFGLLNEGLVSVQVTDAQITFACALADVLCAPADLSQVIPINQFTAVSNALESKGIPAVSLTAGDTYQFLLREIAGMFQFAQRWTAITGVNPFDTNVTLSTRVSSLPVAYRTALQTALNELGYDSSGLSQSSTLRQILNAVATQSDSRSFPFGSYVL